MTRRAIVLAVAAATLASTGPAAPAQTALRVVPVKVFFASASAGARCNHVVARQRLVRPPALLRGAIAALVRGPTAAERARGDGGWFSARTAGTLRSVRIVDGVAHVDFRDLRRVIPNASSSCGSALLLAQLDRTAKQFASVRRAVYSIDGSRRAFYAWLQLDVPA